MKNIFGKYFLIPESEYLFFSALFPFVITSVMLIINCLMFFFSISIHPISVIFSLLCGTLSYYIIVKNYIKLKPAVLIVILWIVVITLSLVIESQIYDITADGQVYHQEAIIQLKEGWNPIQNPESITGNSAEIWTHYPKALWILYADVYSLTNRIQSIKALNLIFFIAIFCLTLYTFINVFSTSQIYSLIFALLIILNPIVIGQLHNFYNDGISYLLLIGFMVSIILLYRLKADITKWILFASSLFLLNSKFTLLVYVFVLCIAFVFWMLINKQFSKLKKIIPIFILIFLFDILIIGYDPYVNNMLAHGHPFYPVMGTGKIDIITWLRPEGYNQMNSLQRFLDANYLSLFPIKIINLKLYFGSYGSLFKNEFGPFFPFISIMSIIILLISCRKDFNSIYFKRYLYIIIVLLITVFINPESWMARYVPQLWLFPLFTFIYFLFFQNNFNSSKKFIKELLIIILSFQVFHLMANYYINTKASDLIRNQLSEFAARPEEIIVNLGQTKSVRKRLEESRISFKDISGNDTIQNNHWEPILYSRSKYFNTKVK